jgi:hypothetical protein
MPRATVVLPLPVGPLSKMLSLASTAERSSAMEASGMAPSRSRSSRPRKRRTCCSRMVMTSGLATGGRMALMRLPSRSVMVTIGLPGSKCLPECSAYQRMSLSSSSSEWNSTGRGVRGLMNSRDPISVLDMPSAARRAICSSCGVSWSIAV